MMLALRIIWGLILSFAVGFKFEYAWEQEHRDVVRFDVKGRPLPKDTYVWSTPTSFLWLVGFILVILPIRFGRSGVGVSVNLLLNVTIYFCTYFVVLIILLPYLRRRISSRACATLWFCPIFMFYGISMFDDAGLIGTGTFSVYIPRKAIMIITLVWLAGFLVSYTWSYVSHLIFRHRVMAEAYAVADESVLAIWKTVCEELDYRRPTGLFVSPFIDSPLSMGRIKRTRCTVLPEKEYTGAELRMIFLHEVHHLQRWDVDTKIFLTFAKCACWFNPFIHIAIKKASQDLELSCDEIVTEKMTPEERRDYARLLLSSASTQSGFTTCLSASAGVLRYRLKNVVEQRPLKLGKAAIMISLFISVFCCNLISFADSRGTLESFVVSEATEADTTYRYLQKYQTMPEDMSDAEIKALLDGMYVEHLLNSTSIFIDEDVLYHIYVYPNSDLSDHLSVTVYENFVTVAENYDYDNPDVYRIMK